MSAKRGNPTDFESFLTWEALTAVLSYDPGTGEFRWVKSGRPGWVGRIAGHVNPLHDGYREIRLLGRVFRASRLAWLHETKQWPTGVVDHINGNRDDNRWENLRDISVAENALNKSVHADNETGISGVHWDAEQSRYIARIAIAGERKYLGSFESIEEAATARRAAETEYYGEFRRTRPLPVPRTRQARINLAAGSKRRGAPSDVTSGLTRAILMRLLSYDPATGEFRWLETSGGEVKIGPPAGKSNKKGYRLIGIGGRLFYAHRLAWLYVTGKWPKALIDHRDGNPANNEWFNLRQATRSQNNANRAAKPGKSGITGVYWHSERGKWTARASVDNKLIYLGIFDTIEEAAAARAAFEKRERDGFLPRGSDDGEAVEVIDSSAASRGVP